MDHKTHPHSDVPWLEVLARLPDDLDLDESAREHGALTRRRLVRDGATLLRLALAYGPGAMSLRSAATWAAACDIAQISDVGLLKRLKKADGWLSHIAATLLAGITPSRASGRRLRIVDGSVIRSPGTGGTDWRLHATYDPAEGRFSQLEISDTHSGESLSRHRFEKGDLVLGDRGYARTPGLRHVLEKGADFITRIGWSTVRLLTIDGARLDWNAIYAGMQPGELAQHEVLVDHSGPNGGMRGTSTFRARLVVRCKDDVSTARARQVIRAAHRKKQRAAPQPQPLTVTSAGYLLLLTSISASEMAPEKVAETYRLRWQIELAFKRLKSGLGIDALPARDRELARSWLAAHLILGLIIDEAVSDTFACGPSMQPRPGTQFSLWRMQAFFRDLLLTSIIGMSRLSRVGHVLAEVTRCLTEPPRRRVSQFAQMRLQSA
jgi:hypothetical protein